MPWWSTILGTETVEVLLLSQLVLEKTETTSPQGVKVNMGLCEASVVSLETKVDFISIYEEIRGLQPFVGDTKIS